MKSQKKRCLIGLQKGVSKTSKGHLLQANWASFRSQKTMYRFQDDENILHTVANKGVS